MMFSLCRSSRATFQPADQNDKAAAVSHCSPADLLYVPGTAPFPQLSCQPFLTLFPLYDCCTWRGLYRSKKYYQKFIFVHISTNLYQKHGHIYQGHALSAFSSFQALWHSFYWCRNPPTSSHHWVGLGEDAPDKTIWSLLVTMRYCCPIVLIKINVNFNRSFYFLW